MQHELFIQNKYTRWYFNIINNSICQSRIKHKKSCNSYVYYEAHHIIPNSIIKNNNTVLLTAKEHFICHLLLTKMLIYKPYKIKMNMAFRLMSIDRYHSRYTSRLYKIHMKSLNFSGCLHTKESKDNISKSRKGIIFSEDHKQKLKEARNKRAPTSEDTKDKMRASRQNISTETKIKMSDSQKKAWLSRKLLTL